MKLTQHRSQVSVRYVVQPHLTDHRLWLSAALLLILSAQASAGSKRSHANQQERRNAVKGQSLLLSNPVVEAKWEVSSGKLKAVSFQDRWNNRQFVMSPDAFLLILKDGLTLKATEMNLSGAPRFERLKGNARASRLAERLDGEQITLKLQSANGKVGVRWRAMLRDGSHYIRQEVMIEARQEDLALREVRLLDWKMPGAQVVGTVKGSPVVMGQIFFGFEHPLAESKIEGEQARCFLARELPLRAGNHVTYSSVIGVTRAGQMRRDFLAYLERERAHPYRPFLHYNSWYDLGYFSKFNEQGALDRISAFGVELNQKRGVKLDSFLFDDGWDDPSTLWHFHAGFPRGFAPLKQAAARYGTSPGVWMSPWGGYGQPKRERLKFGKEQGFETNEGGFALSGPKYFRRFREVCFEMIRQYGINQFKFDGTGNAGRAIAGSEFDSDFNAAISLIGELRTEKPDLYINLTTGTYPSPFWLQYADSIWRGGEDHDFAGVGTNRQRWITYRDSATYSGIVSKGPLFPLSALMLHGLIYAKSAQKLDTDPGNDFGDEIRSYFGTGTQQQEMYVTPSLLSEKNWDTLAEAATWSRQNAAVLKDTHWVGGNPAKLEVYGWAAWSLKKGILTLRNPSDKPQRLQIDVQEIFELPPGAAQVYTAHSPWRENRGQPATRLRAGEKHTFELKPFEVLTLEAVALSRQRG